MRRDRDIFFEALELPDGDEREAYVVSACGADAGLLEKVRGLLAAHRTEAGWLDRPLSALPVPAPAEQAGSDVGRYRLIEAIGEGGFGVVYMAEQREPVKRLVALKIIKQGMDTRQVVARFEAERQALALMDHPNIARVFDGGATEAGRPFFVMELVRGVPITTFCDESLSPTPERLTMFTQVCDAIQHAHQKGVIHRDIKPTNILVTWHDDRPVPKVIDFGIAKATQKALTDTTLRTGLQEFLGTPAYMSPEQADRGGSDVDTRTDIYSLGVLLYELLTGRTPFETRELLGSGGDGLRERLRDREPVKPSTRVNLFGAEERDRAATRRRSEPGQLERTLRGDLDWIVMKALEKDRSRRYESASALAEDIRRYLRDEPVLAAAPSFGYRFVKFARRHRAAFPAAAVIFVLLVAGTATSIWQAKEARREARRARVEAASAEAITRFLNDDLFSMADPAAQPGREITVRALLDRASRQLPGRLADQPLVLAAIHGTLGSTYAKLSRREEAAMHLRAAHELYRRELGAGHEKTLDALLAVAGTLDRRRELTNLVAMVEQARDLALPQWGVDHPISVRCLTQVAWSYYSARRRAEAFETVSNAWAAARRIFEHPETEAFSALHLLARKHSAEGDVTGGERLLRQAVEVHTRTLGVPHPSTFRARDSLAAYLHDAGIHLEEAERLYRESIAGRTAVYGEEHESPQWVRRNLALLLESTGRLPEAWNEFLTVAEKRPDIRETHWDMNRLSSKLPLRPFSLGTSERVLKWRWTCARPSDEWTEMAYNDRQWMVDGHPDRGDVWARCQTEWHGELPRDLRLVLRWPGRGRCELHLNGAMALQDDSDALNGPRYGVCSTDVTGRLKQGTNVIALRFHDVPADAARSLLAEVELLVSVPANSR